MLVGHPPFTANSNHNAENEIMNKIIHKSHSFKGSKISKNAKNLINNMMRKSPTKRFSA